jgi:acyl-CoA dehydrogenase
MPDRTRDRCQDEGVRDGNHYVLNGAKRYITNADKATIFTFMARTDPNTPGAKGLSAFIVERDTPGVTIGKPEKKMGQQGANVCDVIFEDARVPITNRLGEEGEGLKVAMSGAGPRPPAYFRPACRHRRAPRSRK